MSTNPIILIPARMASTRLPGKPLADIGGKPMILRMLDIGLKAGIGPVAIACDGEEIAAAVRAAGGTAIVTDPDLPSGSDRIWQALTRLGGAHDIIINVQGDMPTLDPAIIRQVLALLDNPEVDIATLAAEIRDETEKTDPAVVKPIISFHETPTEQPRGGDSRGGGEAMGEHPRALHGRALYFTRATAPANPGPLYHHIGLYAYRRKALERFVSLPPSPLESREKLEQLRALEAGMRIEVGIVNTVPLGVDTPETLEKARRFYEGR
ncbi:MAG: 3-deoxy-manno-octulosonate cytidylyltransferase [Proteobacteria bacterium]|nr:3-deoxy-manno-octulosonate cytidylyltransferase [Pseudomonadota bacterium]